MTRTNLRKLGAGAVSVSNTILKRCGYRIEERKTLKDKIPEIEDWHERLISQIRPFTMTSDEAIWALIQSIAYADRHGVNGDIVECGVWRGGNMLLAKLIGAQTGNRRRVWLYDTFQGMSEPTEFDRKSAGEPSAIHLWERRKQSDHVDWCYASLDDVRRNLERFGMLDSETRFVEGKVEETLARAENLPEQIAVLRLDTDWYESTKAELDALYPRLAPGGVLIIDDYGHWAGARKAIDEYFAKAPFFHRVDYTCRLAITPRG